MMYPLMAETQTPHLVDTTTPVDNAFHSHHAEIYRVQAGQGMQQLSDKGFLPLSKTQAVYISAAVMVKLDRLFARDPDALVLADRFDPVAQNVVALFAQIAKGMCSVVAFQALLNDMLGDDAGNVSSSGSFVWENGALSLSMQADQRPDGAIRHSVTCVAMLETEGTHWIGTYTEEHDSEKRAARPAQEMAQVHCLYAPMTEPEHMGTPALYGQQSKPWNRPSPLSPAPRNAVVTNMG